MTLLGFQFLKTFLKLSFFPKTKFNFCLGSFNSFSNVFMKDSSTTPRSLLRSAMISSAAFTCSSHFSIPFRIASNSAFFLFHLPFSLMRDIPGTLHIFKGIIKQFPCYKKFINAFFSDEIFDQS